MQHLPNKPWSMAFLLLFTSFLSMGQVLDMELLKGIKPRNIGPAGMSGRVTAADVVQSNPDIIYLGTASGGLWKSTGGGTSWKPIFEKEKAASIGSIAIYQKSPDIIWVGTGEGNPRNSQSMGNGVYRSLDAGQTWQHMGLENTRTIHRIFVHPDDPNTVWVGAQGNAWADSPERGVFKTTDGGKTWKKVLFVNNRTGIADLTIDPTNPNKLIAGMWEYRRWPWFFKSGGEGSGIYVSVDGGENWTKRTSDDGLPEGEIGKTAIAIAPSNPEVVYALVETKKNALYKSIDGGKKWAKVQDQDVGDRPFYYWDLRVDPKNENTLYNVYGIVKVSIDGGKTFETLAGGDKVHVDHHMFYVLPTDASLMLDGNDGGAYISRDRGKTWRFVENLPVGQFYHVNVDMATPYNVMGGMQDNGSWRGPSQSLHNGGIRNGYWDEIAFGDGFDVVPVPGDLRYGYGMSQGGFLSYLDFETGFSQFIKPNHPDNVFLRFNWNAGIAQDPFEANTIYYGSQFIHKSTDRGQNWSLISSDLTTNDPEKTKLETGGLTFDATGAENHCTILAIAPSPLDKNIIWAGTDDGNVQLTRDGGKTWINLSANIKGMPKGAWIPQINASTYNAGEAFVVVNDYRRGNWAPMLYQTKDFGKTWVNLVSEQKVYGYVLSMVQDPIEPKLMFTGTEFGLYVSIDAGQTWTKWTNDYPTVSTYDLKIHPREHDLVIGTFGRALWVMDDIRPLREMASKGAQVIAQPLYAYPAPDAYLFAYKEAAGTRFHGDAIFKGDDREPGALLSYSVKATSKQDTTIKSDTVRLQISDASGTVIRNLFQVVEKPGLQRIIWGLDKKGVRSPESAKPKAGGAEPSGFSVLPGTYTVKYTYAGKEATTKVEVKADPRFTFNQSAAAQMSQRFDRVNAIMEKATAAVDKLNDAKATIAKVNAAMEDSNIEGKEALKKQGAELEKKITELKERLKSKEDVQGIYDDPTVASSRLFMAMYQVGNPYNSLNTNQEWAIDHAEKATDEGVANTDAFFNTEWKAYKEKASTINFSPFKE